MAEVHSMLDRPVYTYREVDRLLGLNQGTAKRWVNGYRHAGRSYPPIVREQPSDTRWVTWGEFIETRYSASIGTLIRSRFARCVV